MNRRVLRALLWGGPAVVFCYSGLTKILAAPATQPEILKPLVSSADYQRLLLGVGVLELATTLLLAWPRSRAAGVGLGLALFTLFSGLVALSPTDESFLTNCGCGALLSSWDFMHDAAAMLVRNGILAAILVSNLGTGAGAKVRNVLAVVSGVLVCLLTAEKLRSRDNRTLLAHILADNRMQRTGWVFPDIKLRREDGSEARADQELKPGDGIMVFSAACVHCKASAAEWPAIRARIEQHGGRFVALEADPLVTGTREFLTEHGLAGVPTYSLSKRRDVIELGVTGVPHFIQLGEGNVVNRQTNGFLHTPTHVALGCIVGADRIMTALGDRLFGEGRFRLTGSPETRGGATFGRGAVDGEEFLLAIGQNQPFDAYRAECGVAIDRDRKVRSAVAIVWTVGLTGMEGPEPYLEKLRGLTLTQTVEYCGKLVTLDDHGHVWMALRSVMSNVASNLP